MSRRDLIALGFKPGAIKRRLESGRLHRVHRGVYAVGRPTLDRRGRWLAAVLACGDDAVLSHRSAAELWALIGGNRSVVDVTSNQGWSGRGGILLHQCKRDDEDQTTHGAIPVTTPTRTLFDLAEVLPPARLRSACEEADRLGLLQIKELERIVERGWGRHALKPIRPVLHEARLPPTVGSPLEDRFLRFCAEHTLPAPATNALVLGYEVDALWPASRLIAELDGFAFHRHRAAFERDRARDAALLVAGYDVIRITHHRLEHESVALAAQVRELLQRS